MALIPNGGSRYKIIKPPDPVVAADRAMLSTASRLQAEQKRPPKVVLKKPVPGIESRGKLGGGRSTTGWYIPESGDVPALKYVSEEFRENLTPEARTALMNVPTRVGEPAMWYAQIPGQALASVLAGKGLNLGLPPGSHSFAGDIDINPEMMESGQERNLEELMQHELIHSWDADRMDEMQSRGETLTGLPGVLDLPREFLNRGPGAEALAGEDLPDYLQQAMESRYPGWLSAPEKYTMMAQVTGFDPAKIPDEYQHLYAGLFNQESFVKPPPPEPLKIDDLLEQQMGGKDSRQTQPPNELIDMEHPYVQNLRDWGFSDKLIWTGLNEITRGRALTSQTLGRIVDEGGASGVAEDTAVEVFEAVTNSYLDALTPRLREEYLEHY